MADTDLSESIHRATFGYPLTITDGKRLLEALLNAQANEGVLRRELAAAKAEAERFQQREPLVRKLWFEVLDKRVCECDGCLEMVDRLWAANAAVAVRDFEVTR